MSCCGSLFGLGLLLALGFRLFLIHAQTNWSLKAKDRKLHGPCELRYICLCFITSCSLHLQLAIRSEVKWYIVCNFLPRKNNNLWVMSLIIFCFRFIGTTLCWVKPIGMICFPPRKPWFVKTNYASDLYNDFNLVKIYLVKCKCFYFGEEKMSSTEIHFSSMGSEVSYWATISHGTKVRLGFFWVLLFPSTSSKHARRWNSQSRNHLSHPRFIPSLFPVFPWLAPDP